MAHFMIEKPLYNLKRGVQLELPLDNPNQNIINFPIKPGMPFYEWYKSKKKDAGMKLASKDDLAGFLSRFFSQKQIQEMSEQEIEDKLQELIEQGVI
tara:strand:+ start:2291 stop:2581 length:291 start_codon:yes stop_codon:yes gene_type:complete